MVSESYIPTDRSMLVHLLQESDPEEVLACLHISSQELLLAFPKKLEVYLSKELSLDEGYEDDYEEDDTEY